MKLTIEQINVITKMLNHMNLQRAKMYSGGVFSKPTKKQRLIEAELNLFESGYKKHIADLGISEQQAAEFSHLVGIAKYLNKPNLNPLNGII